MAFFRHHCQLRQTVSCVPAHLANYGFTITGRHQNNRRHARSTEGMLACSPSTRHLFQQTGDPGKSELKAPCGPSQFAAATHRQWESAHCKPADVSTTFTQRSCNRYDTSWNEISKKNPGYTSMYPGFVRCSGLASASVGVGSTACPRSAAARGRFPAHRSPAPGTPASTAATARPRSSIR